MNEKEEALIKVEWIRQHCIISLLNAKKYEKWALNSDHVCQCKECGRRFNRMPERVFAAAVIDQYEYMLKTFFNNEQEFTSTPGNR